LASHSSTENLYSAFNEAKIKASGRKNIVQNINAEFTVVQMPITAVPQKGMYIFLGWLFCFFFSTKKEKEKLQNELMYGKE
jgi:nitrate reductase NapE component